ncbi:MAG TPA: L-2-amino-thiazoline-4-carboxylic acid hydrolase [Burkholderiaceae bacterium]|nr:L-2-amino-thiazoline-4-carboxylic acid hydrolase [Burkholderiaceae bacterium]
MSTESPGRPQAATESLQPTGPAQPSAAAHPPGLSMLARRRIEAEILGHVYEVLKASHGKELAMQVIGDATRRSSIEQAQRFAADTPQGTSLQSFVELSKLWETEDALKIEVRERTADRYAFDVVRCRYAEMYKAMGLGEIGHLLSCQRDGTFCEGYDPRLKFRRTQTIMQGASHCDFRYDYEADR